MRNSALRAFAVAFLALSPPAWGACSRPVLLNLAPGIHAIPGRGAEPDRHNCGRSANGLVITGRDGMILVDPGPSRKAGKALQAVLGGMSGLPVVAIVLTHAHPENTLATGALSGPGVPVIASDLAAGLMYERCPRCLARLQRSVGASGMKGTRIILPNHTVAQSDTRVIGGRSMRLLRFEHAHTRGDLAVLDEETRVLFAGGLAVAEVIPDLGEGSLAGWRQALTELADLRPRCAVPGIGRISCDDVLGTTLAYLDALAAFVKREMDAGGDLAAALERAAMPTFAGWSGYPRRHLLNVQRAWQEMEGEFFFATND